MPKPGIAMKTKNVESYDLEMLRSKTKGELRLNLNEPSQVRMPADDLKLKRLLHELQVNQIELEMRNEELNQGRIQLEEALNRYTEFYELAPVGLLSLARDGVILNANLAAATLLGAPRSDLRGRNLELFLSSKSCGRLKALLDTVFTKQGTEHVRDLTIAGRGDSQHVRISATASGSITECSVSLVDVTEGRRTEAELKKTKQMASRVGQHTHELPLVVDDLVAEKAERNRLFQEVREKDLQLIKQAYPGAASETSDLHQERKGVPGAVRPGTQQEGGSASYEFHGSVPERFRKAARYMEHNLADSLYLEAVAREAYLSKFHFCREFKKHLGVTPIQFMLTRRIAHAANLLETTDLPIVQVATKSGFNDQSEFSRWFKRTIGLTPSSYRKSLAAKGPADGTGRTFRR